MPFIVWTFGVSWALLALQLIALVLIALVYADMRAWAKARRTPRTRR